MSNDERRLPVIESYEVDGEQPSCSPKIYISNEEASLLATMRDLRERSLSLRHRLKSAGESERTTIESELEGLRAQHREASKKREQAFTRKMIMLGHLPPTYPVEG